MTSSKPGVIGFDATSLEVANRAGVSHYTARLLASLTERKDGWSYRLLSGRKLRGAIPADALSLNAVHFPNRTFWMQVLLPLALGRMRLPLCHFTNFLAPIYSPCPFIVTIHDMSLFMLPSMHPRKSLWAVRSLLPMIARRAAAIVTVSQSARRDILSVLQIPAEKIRVIPEAAGEEFRYLDASPDVRRVAAAYSLHDPFILSVGTLEPRKNLHRLVAAYARLKDRGMRERLLLVGQRGWKCGSLWREIIDLGLKDDVRALGYVPEADLPAIFRLARVLAFPSLYEGFGLPILEAMACGTPVLTSNCSSMPEIAGDAAVLVDPRSSESIEEGLHRILANASLREDLRRAGLARSACFSWAKAAAETTQLYSTVAV